MERVKFEELNFLIKEKQFRELKQILEKNNPLDSAEFIENSDVNAAHFFRILSKEKAADIFVRLSGKMQRRLAGILTERELSLLIELLPINDTVSFLRKLPPGMVKRILKYAEPERKNLISVFLTYPKNSVGGIMSAEFIELHKSMNVKEAIDAVKKSKKETVYNCYVTDEDHVLHGAVSLKTLLSSKEDAFVEDIMTACILSLSASKNKKSALKLLSAYEQSSIPVTDGQNHIIGIVTAAGIKKITPCGLWENFKLGLNYPFQKMRCSKSTKQL